MKFFVDLLPIIVFFTVYKLTGDFLLATISILAATGLQMAYSWIRHRKIERIHLISAGLLAVLGGMTLLFDNSAFLQWKPTILYWVMGVAVLVSQFWGKKNLTQRSLEGLLKSSNVQLQAVPNTTWNRLNLSVFGFLAAIGVANLYVAFQFSESAWVNFKLFGLTGITLVFMVALIMPLSRYMESEQKTEPAIINEDQE
ncbi:septation protein A [Zooshikella sp. RANM57]|uniref:septation protein A n=1 Tax=Zooshikella sp. RANM57 TaxID=3425863 RepID=UPI003D6E06A9